MIAQLVAIALASAVSLAAVQRPACTQKRLDQENYLALTERVYAYVGEIASPGSAGEWKPFSVRLLVGMYRRPLLLPQGIMRESDLRSLLSSRTDIKVEAIAVQGNDAKAGQKFAPDAPKPTMDPVSGVRGTIRVLKVAAPGKAPGGVTLEVCGF